MYNFTKLELIDSSIVNPKFVKDLLKIVGNYVDPLVIIERIPEAKVRNICSCSNKIKSEFIDVRLNYKTECIQFKGYITEF